MIEKIIERLQKEIEEAKQYGMPQFTMGIIQALDIVKKEFKGG